ncbi:AAA family ATPase [Paenibacillus amylolyticus]|uniref:AAA family ATPase n=1 Tax=Paenibacillus amylolyticus TaxID=1451 RepID=UPI003EBCF473
MIHSFSVDKYKNLNIDKTEFSRVNIIIGPNNAGKSNFIDAIHFISNTISNRKTSSAAQKSAFLNELQNRGWGAIYDRRQDRPGEIKMSWQISVDESTKPFVYRMHFLIPESDQHAPDGFRISFEQLQHAEAKAGKALPYNFVTFHEQTPGQGWVSARERDLSNKAKRIKIEISNQDTFLNQIEELLADKVFYKEYYANFRKPAEQVRHFFGNFFSYSSTDFDLRKVKMPVILGGARFLDGDASNFVNVLYHLEEEFGFLKDYMERIYEVVDHLESIEFETVGQYLQLWLTIDGARYRLSEMSDGTIKIMIFALLLWTPERYKLLSLDEPELNLHPAWLKPLSTWISRAESTEQLFVSTHSSELLDGLSPAFESSRLSLFVFQQNVDNSLSKVLPEQIQDQLSEGWQLGDLYRIGEPRLGGWPW